MHHIFVNKNNYDKISNKIIITKNEDSDNYIHLVKSLRANVGEIVLCSLICDDSFYKTKIVAIDNEEVICDVKEKIVGNELNVKINLYQGITKSDKFEYIIEKAVELGAFTITPVAMDFSIAKMDNNKIKNKLERYNKISKAAAEQSRRNIIPEVKKPITFSQMLNVINEKDIDYKLYNLLFYENVNGIKETKQVISEMVSDINKKILNIIIGPEGGFSDDEIEKAEKYKIKILSLGDRILRTETASVTAMSILMYELQQ